MSTFGPPSCFFSDLCELAHNRQPEARAAKAGTTPEAFTDGIALLDASGERVRHDGDRAVARSLAETAKRAAEMPEMPETSNPSEIAAFSAMARSGGNWRKPAEILCAGPGPPKAHPGSIRSLLGARPSGAHAMSSHKKDAPLELPTSEADPRG